MLPVTATLSGYFAGHIYQPNIKRHGPLSASLHPTLLHWNRDYMQGKKPIMFGRLVPILMYTRIPLLGGDYVINMRI